MEGIGFKGITSALILNSSLILKCNDEGLYNATIYYRENGEKLGQIEVVDESLTNCVLKAERILNKSKLAKNTQEFLQSLTGIDWLLKKKFAISVSKNNETYYGIRVSADDYLCNNGLFHSNSSNGVCDLLESCNDWADTLRNHIEPMKELEKEL